MFGASHLSSQQTGGHRGGVLSSCPQHKPLSHSLPWGRSSSCPPPQGHPLTLSHCGHLCPHCHSSGSLQVPSAPRGAGARPLLPCPPRPAPLSVPTAGHAGGFTSAVFTLTFPQSHLYPGARQPSRVCRWAGPCSQESSEAPEASVLRIPQPWELPNPWGAPRSPRTRRDPQGTGRDALFQLGPCLC